MSRRWFPQTHLKAIPSTSLIYKDATRALRLVEMQRDHPQNFEAAREEDYQQCLNIAEAQPKGTYIDGNQVYEECSIFDVGRADDIILETAFKAAPWRESRKTRQRQALGRPLIPVQFPRESTEGNSMKIIATILGMILLQATSTVPHTFTREGFPKPSTHSFAGEMRESPRDAIAVPIRTSEKICPGQAISLKTDNGYEVMPIIWNESVCYGQIFDSLILVSDKDAAELRKAKTFTVSLTTIELPK
jgi:hypothetical protein